MHQRAPFRPLRTRTGVHSGLPQCKTKQQHSKREGWVGSQSTWAHKPPPAARWTRTTVQRLGRTRALQNGWSLRNFVIISFRLRFGTMHACSPRPKGCMPRPRGCTPSFCPLCAPSGGALPAFGSFPVASLSPRFVRSGARGFRHRLHPWQALRVFGVPVGTETFRGSPPSLPP